MRRDRFVAAAVLAASVMTLASTRCHGSASSQSTPKPGPAKPAPAKPAPAKPAPAKPAPGKATERKSAPPKLALMKPAAKPAHRPVTLPRETAEIDTPHEKKIAELREKLEAILHESPLGRARVGVEVMQISDGDVLFSHNADLRFNPASNTKILTTAAAIARLGGDYRYLTGLYSVATPDIDGVLEGNIVLRGSADPSLSTADLAELAHLIAEKGITRVRGDLVVDRRPIGCDEPGCGEHGTDGLILNRNGIAVRVRPTEPKHAPVVSIEPAAGITIENAAMTVKGKRGRLKLDVFRKDDHLVVRLTGRIGESRGSVVIGQRVTDGALLCGHTLAGLLPDFGVTLEGRVRGGEQPKRTTTLATASDTTSATAIVGSTAIDDEPIALHRSAPLADVSRLSNKPSNNFVADAIYKTLGGELFGLPGTLEKGTRAVSDWLSEHGLDREHFHLVNGSGLTHENRITPGDLARLLRAIYFEPALAPDFLPSLAVAGIDGTIRNRFNGTPAVGLVRAKTGTLSGVSALSGYVGDKGDVIVFTILVEGFRQRNMTAVRHAQVRLVDSMLRYLRSDAVGDEPGVRPAGPVDEGPLPPSMEDGEPPTDSESDGDPAP